MKKKTGFAFQISRKEIDQRIRKTMPPPTQRHRDATTYRRHKKHPHETVEE